ncbi:monovalent cation/H+ antiporter complex subunit F [Streptomyces spiramenti]|uniref:Pesticidal protein Cry26Aa n=1 Tax=Streptomyces spiramenti TaxID=2720606 RepID=A0ABX1ACB9_9ACTN|nr:monovalent cation/H+ antiporter complex subunit F [Streptomyces spiramenti]NJP64852.1 pesticidal protein Cry26Aa [Streptomyces spiramenti]
MTGIDFAAACCGAAALIAAYRIVRGPTPADRAIAADLLSFAVIGLIAAVGTRLGSGATMDLVLVATLVAFLAAVSLARALTRGAR